eukprot:TRINITY_DN43331_c0_g1_i1.p1 TRINITY_DN43331_c0_g1~~TRINITY_DN43331_c0_g1_i1.p1  ORF type:complete len:476 (-),score=21.65 TRINITY_DN43331_c0_g1_i1:155-1495(-)
MATASHEACLDKDEETSNRQPPRLHYLDWMRLLMIWSVVYAHTDRIIGDVMAVWVVDDLNQQGSSLIGVRMISLIRPWCLPILFWVSGKAQGLKKDGRPTVRGLCNLFLLTFIGMFSNLCLWQASPRDPSCSPQQPCHGKGRLVDFSIIYDSGYIFPIIFQMWYVIALIILTLVNWPLCAVLSLERPADPGVLILQWGATTMLCFLFLWAAGEEVCERPLITTAWVSAGEIFFLYISTFAACDGTRRRRLSPFPLRIVHYSLAFVTVLQFGLAPFMNKATTLGPAFVAYIFVGFNRCFSLGFIMGLARHSGDEVDSDDARPSFSKVWPLILVLLVAFTPSTNWMLAGNLTYPYYTEALDRMLYVAGSLVMLFIIDRLSRLAPCEPLPSYLGKSALGLYLFHPVCLTVLFKFHLLRSVQAWFLSVGIAVSMTFVVEHACKAKQSHED